MTFSWVMKRLALCIGILVFAVGSVAWLTYASIDQTEAQSKPAQTAASQ
jgi:hypothetical protein